MRLYELTSMFNELFDTFESIDEWEPEQNEQGLYVDENGDTRTVPEEYIESVRNDLREAWFANLTCIEEDFDDKAVQLALYVKSLNAEAEAIKAEKLALEQRQRSKVRRAERITEYIKTNMQAIGREYIEDRRVKISLKLNPVSVALSNEKEFIEYLKQNEPSLLRTKYEVDKTAVKNALKSGEDLPGAALVRIETVKIKYGGRHNGII